MLHLYWIVIQGVFVNELSAVRRTWQSDISYSNPNNWNVRRVPCETERLVFPENMGFAVELADVASVRELVLPSSGDVILSRNGEFSITDRHAESASCQGNDAEFKKFQAMYWLDAIHWDGWNSATPDLERIPCKVDTAVFRKGGTYAVVMPSETVQISGLSINGENMDVGSWYVFSRSEVGLQQFSKSNYNPGDIEISGSEYLCEETGCECSNEYLKTSVCQRNQPCPAAGCFHPVKPKGFCCEICGSVVTYKMIPSVFRLKELNTKLQKEIIKSNWPIIFHASRYGDTIQVVLVENGSYSGDIDDVSEKLEGFIVKGNLGLHQISLQSSGPLYYKTPALEHLKRFFVTMLAACLFITGIFIFFNSDTVLAVSRTIRSSERPFLFTRFENQGGLGGQSVSVLSLPQAFDNPMYGTNSQAQSDIVVENPVYTELLKEEEEAEEVTELEEKESPKEYEKMGEGICEEDDVC